MMVVSRDEVEDPDVPVSWLCETPFLVGHRSEIDSFVCPVPEKIVPIIGGGIDGGASFGGEED